MGKNYRFTTKINSDKQVKLNIEQDFDQLEILSLKLRQEDLYSRFCADYGVVAGRVIANGGFGIPNVNVSIFVPLDELDENDPIISTLYPYSDLTIKNEDGYRYNLLPYKSEYKGHVPTGTFPDREDVLNRREVLSIYEKYYKYTAKTNESGDFMIVGVPLGNQKIVMDCDLSNIGEFSLRPADLIRMGIAVESQFDGENFKSSENLDSLPQIINDVKDVDISSFWGQEDLCDVGITRVDFDLRELGIEIEPTSVFLGSIFSTEDSEYLRRNCKAKSDAGNLCQMRTNPGKILALRQTIDLDETGFPIIERYNLENDGNIIDENGAWVTELPMNLDYVITNEFGEQILSDDPSLGIPTKAKYRFRIKWQNESDLQADIMRADYLVPNIKEHGWSSDTNFTPNRNSSYAFSLDWNEYADPQAAVNCEDTFYQFLYNKVYTIASHIDRFKWGVNRARHLGIKEINDRSCSSDINKPPVNEAQRNFDFLAFLMNILLFIATPLLTTIIPVLHVLALLYPIIRFIINLLLKLINGVIYTICKVVRSIRRAIGKSRKPRCSKSTITNLPKENPFKRIKLPMLSYPNCETCSCNESENLEPDTENETIKSFGRIGIETNTILLNAFETESYINYDPTCSQYDDDSSLLTIQTSGSEIFTFDDSGDENVEFGDFLKISARSPIFIYDENYENIDIYTHNRPTLPQLLNQINQRSRYFYNLSPQPQNIIKTTVKNDVLGTSNSDSFTDLPLILIVDKDLFSETERGDILSFTDFNDIEDPNLDTGDLNSFGNNNNTFNVLYNETTYITREVNYVDEFGVNQIANVQLYNPNEIIEYEHTSGVDYYQVIHIQDNIEEFLKSGSNPENPIDFLYKFTYLHTCGNPSPLNSVISKEMFNRLDELDNHKVIILNKGVDMYTPKQKIEFDVSRLYGEPYGTVVEEGDFRMNFPIINDSGDFSVPEPHFQRDGVFNFESNINDSALFNKPYLLNEFPNMINFKTNKFSYYSCLSSDTSQDFSSVFNGEDDNFYNFQGRVDGSSAHLYLGSDFTFLTGSLAYGKLSINDLAVTYSGIYDNLPETEISTDNLVFRSDRLPTSDIIEGLSEQLELSNPSNFNNLDKKTKYPLYLNSQFIIYDVLNNGAFSPSQNIDNSSTDNSGNEEDFIEDYDGDSQVSGVLESSTCENMVPLECYEGSGETFRVKENCNLGLISNESSDRIVENGCYSFVRPPYILTIVDDFKLIIEWRSRFRFLFSACRGVIGEMFQNNWLNGSLYMPSFQKLTFFNSRNEVSSYRYCGTPASSSTQHQGPVYFNDDTNSFYYRSTPFGNGQFYGQRPSRSYTGANDKNIWSPTTIMDLGSRDSFLQEISLLPEFQNYIVDTLKTSSYNDTSEIVNIFILSRLVNSNFLTQVLGLGDASIANLFSRNDGPLNFVDGRIDADAAQMFSINSEYGVRPYLLGNYDNDSLTVSGSGIGIWYESNKVNRKVLSPGIKTFGEIQDNITVNFGYENDQKIPHYLWRVNNNDKLFGNKENNWNTSIIASTNYQSDNFTNSNYPRPDNTFNGTGYLYNDDNSGNVTNNPSTPSQFQNNFKVGAPYHFYFGLKKGSSALNKFIQKYLFLDEL